MAKLARVITDGSRPKIPDAHVAMVRKKVSEIEGASLERLREIWTQELGLEPPKCSRSPELFRQIVAWRVQEKYLGGLSEWAEQELDQMVAGLNQDPTGKSMLAKLKPGMILVREWKGDKYRVLVRDDGFEHEGKPYASLSKVARHITGARWSGPLFFGLKLQPKRRKAA